MLTATQSCTLGDVLTWTFTSWVWENEADHAPQYEQSSNHQNGDEGVDSDQSSKAQVTQDGTNSAKDRLDTKCGRSRYKVEKK